jgi:hypothetical protein
MLNQLQRGDEPALLPCRRSGFLRRPEVDMIKKRRLSWQRRPLIIDLWVVTFNQINQRFQMHNSLRLPALNPAHTSRYRSIFTQKALIIHALPTQF